MMRLSKIVFLLIVTLLSCSKDKDEQRPVITITSPSHLSQINVPGFYSIVGTITDDKNLENVKISLKDANDIPLLSTIILHPNSSQYQLDETFLVDDLRLESGTYTFDISAFDGENTSHHYVSVFISGSSKQRNGIFIFDNNTITTNIHLLDNSLNATFFKSLNGDFLGAVINSYDQQLMSTAGIAGKFSALDPLNGQKLWEVDFINQPPTPYLTGVFYNNKTVYIGLYDGVIRGYGTNGVQKIEIQTINGFYCESGFVHDDLMITEQHDIGSNAVRLVLYYEFSGAERQQRLINEDILDMYSFNSNEIVVLSNDASNNGKLSFYNIENGGYNSPFNIGVGEIIACTEVASGVYIISRNGDLIMVNAHTFSTLPYLSGVNASFIKYDDFTNQLYVVSGNTLYIYNYSSKTLIGSYVHNSPILELLFWNNK